MHSGKKRWWNFKIIRFFRKIFLAFLQHCPRDFSNKSSKASPRNFSRNCPGNFFRDAGIFQKIFQVLSQAFFRGVSPGTHEFLQGFLQQFIRNPILESIENASGKHLECFVKVLIMLLKGIWNAFKNIRNDSGKHS